MVNVPWIWTGLLGDNFGDGLNWAAPLAPSALSDCEIGLTAPTNVLAGNETINSLATTANVTLTILANDAFTLLGASDLIVPTGVSSIAGTLALSAGAQLNIDGVFHASGQLQTAAGSKVLVDNGLFNTGVVHQSGDFTFGDASHVGAVQNAAGATWDISGSGSDILKGTSAPGAVFANLGLLDHLSGNSQIGVATRNTGQITDSGGELDFLGGVSNTGAISVTTGVLTIGAVAGAGVLNIEQSGALTLVTGTAEGEIVKFAPAANGLERLNLGRASTFEAHIQGFTGTDVIDLQHVLATTESFAGGVLTLKTHGTTVGQLHFDGNYSTPQFTLGSDGAGGTLIHFA